MPVIMFDSRLGLLIYIVGYIIAFYSDVQTGDYAQLLSLVISVRATLKK